MRLAGTISVPKFTVGFGETFVLDSSVDVQATGDIEIFGRLLVDRRSKPGSGLRLHSSGGNILIAGRIATSNGADGDTPPVSTSVVAGDGKPGGAIEIVSATGQVLILQGAELKTGAGGRGGDATAEGTMSAHTLVKAVSGAGGAGGAIAVSAGDLLIIEGALRPGPGGAGGTARATGMAPGLPPPVPSENANPPWGRTHPPLGDGAPRQRPPDIRQFPAVVEATGKAGGAGGDIAIATTVPDGVVQLAGVLRGGDGGNSATAAALSGGRRATALLEAGGRGGNIAITLLDSPRALQDAARSELRGGNGGICGDTSILGQPTTDPRDPPNIFADNAIAVAGQTALAWVGYPAERGKPAGGAPGTVTAVRLWPGGPPVITDPIVLSVTQADGGDSTGAIATAGAKEEHEMGDSHLGAAPGKVQKAEVA
jgi:hypothetical protein